MFCVAGLVSILPISLYSIPRNQQQARGSRQVEGFYTRRLRRKCLLFQLANCCIGPNCSNSATELIIHAELASDVLGKEGYWPGIHLPRDPKQLIDGEGYPSL